MNRVLDKDKSKTFIAAFLIGLLSFGFYFSTLAPTIMWGDPAKLVLNAYTSHFRIFQGNHLLLGILGHWFGKLPFENYAYSQNLLSAILGAITLSMIYLITVQITKSRFLAIMAPMSLMVSHTFWWESVMMESYTLYALSIVSLIYVSVIWENSREDKWLYLFSFVLGLSFCNNESVLLYLPAFLYLFIFREKRVIFNIKRLLIILIWFVVGLTPWICVAIKTREFYASVPIWDYVLGPVTKAGIHERSSHALMELLVLFPAYLLYQFPIIGFILGIFGAWRLLRERSSIGVCLLLVFVINLIIAGIYMSERRHNVLIVGYAVFSLWIAYALYALWEKLKTQNNEFTKRRVILLLITFFVLILPIIIYYNIPKILEQTNYRIPKIRTLPFRDNYRYFYLPDKSNYYGPETFAKSVFATVERDSVVISDFTPMEVLRYFQVVEQLRPDVRLVGIDVDGLDLGIIENNIDNRPIYLVDIDDYQHLYKLDILKKEYALVPSGPIYKLVKK